MPAIRNLLARRSDLSTFVVHLTRDTGSGARANLEGILTSGRILAKSPFGPAIKSLANAGLSDCLSCQEVVCFTETPLEHLHLMLEEITDLKRTCVFAPYGLAFTKRIARESGVNPVWYTDITPNGRDWLMKSVNQLIDEAVNDLLDRRNRGDDAAQFRDYPIAQLAPFIEQMGTGAGYRKEFWWEREWRHRGDYLLPLRYLIIAPEDEHDDLKAIPSWGVGAFIDAGWGLEEIIGRLAGFTSLQVGSF